MIRLDSVYAGYGRRDVLKDVTLHIGAGEMAGILGPNGSGKTTLLLAVSGVLRVRSGSIVIDGHPLQRLTPKAQARLMAGVPQKVEIAFDLRVNSIVLMGRYPHIRFLGGYRDHDREIALEAMRETRTLEFRDRLMGELSGGEFQRVLIARALAQSTEILLLDEAASGLDIARKVEIYDLLRRRNAAGTTILSVIHDLNLAALYCDRLIFMKNGRVVLDGRPEDVFTEEKLEEIYETHIRIAPHPLTGVPQAHLVPGADCRRMA
jgi:iron complex transport system ATP-binding protein